MTDPTKALEALKEAVDNCDDMPDNATLWESAAAMALTAGDIRSLAAQVETLAGEMHTANDAIMLVRTICDRHECGAAFVDDCVERLSRKLATAESALAAEKAKMERIENAYVQRLAIYRGKWEQANPLGDDLYSRHGALQYVVEAFEILAKEAGLTSQALSETEAG